ncbi:hypothetical protein U1Q18_032238, partial [Sarracenia purpurea var. burkii]
RGLRSGLRRLRMKLQLYVLSAVGLFLLGRMKRRRSTLSAPLIRRRRRREKW